MPKKVVPMRSKSPTQELPCGCIVAPPTMPADMHDPCGSISAVYESYRYHASNGWDPRSRKAAEDKWGEVKRHIAAGRKALKSPPPPKQENLL